MMMDLFLFLGAVVGMAILLIVGALFTALGLLGIVSIWFSIKETISEHK